MSCRLITQGAPLQYCSAGMIPARLTSPVLPHREAGVITALPMQEQLDLIIFYSRHDLTHHSADETLTRDGGRRRMMPSGLQVGTHLQQTLPFLGIQRRRSLSDQRLQLLLEHLHRREGGIPPPLELAGNKTIVRIDSVILPPRPGCLVSCLFERQLKLALFLASLVLAVRDCTDRRIDAERCSKRTISAPTAWSTRRAPNEMQGAAAGSLRVASQ